jgi:hypothetical protein
MRNHEATKDTKRNKHKTVTFVAFIILVLSPPVLFAEENIEKKDIPAVTQTNNEEGAWTGIDVSVVGKYAEKYGHPPRDPYINTDQGDLLLFVFTAAGVIGGFIIGFNVRKIFYEKHPEETKSEALNPKQIQKKKG